jgi:hypothetical protein
MTIPENKQESNNVEQNQKDFFDMIPTKERNAFQYVLLKKMGAERGNHELQSELSTNFSADMHRIIDDTSRKDNKQIRALIMEGKNEEAAEIVDEILKKEIYN